MKYTNRADLLIAAGESIKMQELAGIEPVGKFEGRFSSYLKNYKFDALEWEFPLAVVEGKPVFVGDELYDKNGNKFIILDCYARVSFVNLSWNPPKPKTVMVELLRENAEKCANGTVADSREVIILACRKALDQE
jgi:hypothetical protein